MSGWRLKHGRRWSRESIIAAMREYTDRHGEAPTFEDWRLQSGDYPNAKTVRRHFGSWSVALREAGLGERHRGDFKIVDGRRPTFDARFKARWERRMAVRDITDLQLAQQFAMLDPTLRSLIIGQLRDDRWIVHPQTISGDALVAIEDLDFEVGNTPGFEDWLVPALDERQKAS